MMKYLPEHQETAFLLGGIGTGNVSIGARGELRDWELFNRPGKGNSLPCTFNCLRIRPEGGEPLIRILEARIRPPYSGPNGWRLGSNEFPGEMGGIPRFADSEMTIEYPFINIRLIDESLPVHVSLEAFTPFIPLDSVSSAYPGAFFRYRVKNITHKPLEVTVVSTLLNVVGFNGLMPAMEQFSQNRNLYRQNREIKGLFMDKRDQDQQDVNYGSLALLTDQEVSCKPEWIRGEWWDGVQEFWDDLYKDGDLESANSRGIGSDMKAPDLTIGSLAVKQRILPGEEQEFRLVLAWYFPNRSRGWWAADDCGIIRNHYATVFSSAWDAGLQLLRNFTYLYAGSKKFSTAMRECSIPPVLRDAALRNLTVLRSPTCFRLEDGTFLGWEGCLDRTGSCHGTCTHVYNYAQSIASLFPDLEQSCRRTEFLQETDSTGAMAFRSQTPFGWPRSGFVPAIDGQFGTIVRLYREWALSGDTDLIQELWPGAKRALDFGLNYWDPDGDGLPEAKQHNTYDIEFYGPNPLGAIMMMAALAAGIRIAEHLGDEVASVWQERLDRTKENIIKLFNGQYFYQIVDDSKYKYQPGSGCLTDQLMGQYMADNAGLGDLLSADMIRSALQSIIRYNFIERFSDFTALHRTYALNDESGLVLCTWPDGSRPPMPMPYSDEVWSGSEYAVAAMLLRRGEIEKACKIVQAIDERHDGHKRNPFNEAECGHHYARSMASWSLIDAWSGRKCDLPGKRIDFTPQFAKTGKAFFSCASAWGLLICEDGRWQMQIMAGSLAGTRVFVHGQEIEVV